MLRQGSPCGGRSALSTLGVAMGTDSDDVRPDPGPGVPTLSVVIPTYNRRDGILRLLQALAEQTLPSDQFEVVVVNDGSTDDTAEALACFAAPYRLRVLEQANA